VGGSCAPGSWVDPLKLKLGIATVENPQTLIRR
jgi:hypothetical protein